MILVLAIFILLFIVMLCWGLRLQQKLNDLAKTRTKTEREVVAKLRQADSALTAAREQADSELSSAREEVASLAARSDELRATAKAYENKIIGYGDEYLYPSSNLLDDLAEEYSFSDAGQDLKKARQETKALVKSKSAATCEWMDGKEAEGVLAVILDAFNGKVDSVLTRTKHDNYGTLAQEIKDAYLIVNQIGQGFRKAKITEAYLASRLNELRCGTIAFELKEKDRQEQREIKEKMREEEKARREQEKAMKDSAREEEIIRQAMERARKEAESASAEQRAGFAARMAELEAKLAEAEAKALRAKSMAEQTKSGYVYIISNIGSFGDDVVKIGMTRRLNPQDRVDELGDASVPFAFDVHAMIYSKDAPRLESLLHHRFNHLRMNKVNFRKEFFKTGVSEIKKVLDDLGIAAMFTLQAEARQYRDSLQIDKMTAEEKARLLDGLMQEEDADDMAEVGVDMVEV